MKTLITVLLMYSLNLEGAEGTLQVEVANLKSTEGAVYLSLYSSEGEFLKKAFRQTKVETISGESVILTLENLPFGNYAISVMHDENLNGEMDSGAFGIPQEGYGFSNNAKGMFGPPSYDASQFEFTSDASMTIQLIHPPF